MQSYARLRTKSLPLSPTKGAYKSDLLSFLSLLFFFFFFLDFFFSPLSELSDSESSLESEELEETLEPSDDDDDEESLDSSTLMLADVLRLRYSKSEISGLFATPSE